MLSNIRKFAVASTFLFITLAVAACAAPPSAPAATEVMIATVEATTAATEAVATTEATEEATTTPTEAMTATVEATEAMTATVEATTTTTEVMTATAEATTGAAEAMTGTVEATTVATDTAMAEIAINVGNSSLGDILTDEAGRTLYVFKNDSDETSACYDGCAQNWPPLLTAGSPQAGTGVDTALLGATERTDGTMQVTYNGMPLYYFARDTAAGDVNGQGVGEVWYVVSPTGEMIES